MEAVLHRLQQFDPPGVVARGLQESLLIQLRQRPAGEPYLDKAITLIAEHFDLLAQQDHNQLKRKLKISEEGFARDHPADSITDPRPGTWLPTQKLIWFPDVFVSRQDGVWHVELNSEATPKLRVIQNTPS